MVRWHHRLNGHEFEQVLGDSEGQGSLVCYSPWGRKELGINECLNNFCQKISKLSLEGHYHDTHYVKKKKLEKIAP